MSARFDSPWSTPILLALAGYLTAFASLGRGMRRLTRLSVFIPLVWISLLCGASWAAAPNPFVERQPTHAPYTSLQRDSSPPPASQRLILKESDACEKLLAWLERSPDEGVGADLGPDTGIVAPRVLLLALLHSGLSPPSAGASPPYPSADRPLTSAYLLSSADARAPPLG